MVDDDDWCRSAQCLIGRFLKEIKMVKINLDLAFTYITGFELSMFCYFATTTAHYVMSSLWLQLMMLIDIYIYISPFPLRLNCRATVMIS